MRHSWLSGLGVLAMGSAVVVCALAVPTPSAFATRVAVAGLRLQVTEQGPISRRVPLLLQVITTSARSHVVTLPARSITLHRQACTTDCAQVIAVVPLALNLYVGAIDDVPAGRYEYETTSEILEITAGPDARPPHRAAPVLATSPWGTATGMHRYPILQLAGPMPGDVIGLWAHWGASTAWFARGRADVAEISFDANGCRSELPSCERLDAGMPVELAWVSRDGTLSARTTITR